MIDIYCYPKCSTCKKAVKWLDEANQSYHYIDIKQTPPSKEELLQWMNDGDFTIKQFFNTSGLSYRALNLKEKLSSLTKEEASELLASDGMLIKRPLVLKGKELVAIGFKEEVFQKLR